MRPPALAEVGPDRRLAVLTPTHTDRTVGFLADWWDELVQWSTLAAIVIPAALVWLLCQVAW